MDAADRSTLTGTETAIRKTWATPVVIVASTTRETLSAHNSLGPDAVYPSTSIGS